MTDWKKQPHNEILQGENFYICFVSSISDVESEAPEFRTLGLMGGLLGLETKETETALKAEGGPWLILNGDFRKEYKEAFPLGYEACVAVYNRHKAQHRSDWASDEPVKQ